YVPPDSLAQIVCHRNCPSDSDVSKDGARNPPKFGEQPVKAGEFRPWPARDPEIALLNLQPRIKTGTERHCRPIFISLALRASPPSPSPPPPDSTRSSPTPAHSPQPGPPPHERHASAAPRRR